MHMQIYGHSNNFKFGEKQSLAGAHDSEILLDISGPGTGREETAAASLIFFRAGWDLVARKASYGCSPPQIR